MPPVWEAATIVIVVDNLAVAVLVQHSEDVEDYAMIEMVTMLKTWLTLADGKSRRNRTKKTIMNWVYWLMALKVYSAFRTMSDEAELVVVHIQNKTQECCTIWLAWFLAYADSLNGRCVHGLIPNFRVWLERRVKESKLPIQPVPHRTRWLLWAVSALLWWFAELSCMQWLAENAEHVVFYCSRFALERKNLN